MQDPARSLSIDLLRALQTSGLHALGTLARQCDATPARARRELAALVRQGYARQADGPGEERYAVAGRFDFLAEPALRAALGPAGGRVSIRVTDACPSTNSALLELGPEAMSADVAFLITEAQTAGRGRRGRSWISGIGQAITCSTAFEFALPLRHLSGLSLAVGVAAARAFARLGASGIRLKWPNDLMVGPAKLGGILVETRATRGVIRVVIGIGINHAAEAGLGRRLRRSITALAEVLDPLPSRNVVAGTLLGELLVVIDAFAARGLDAVRAEWEALHAHAGHCLHVQLSDGRDLSGTAVGIDADGALLLATATGLVPVSSGEVVSARPA
jgi:BirA family biotin operon repressor/biotin-[acetyl-CoA-carboxylase] ligase